MLLLRAYTNEVTSRHEAFTDDGQIRECIAEVARYFVSDRHKAGLLLLGKCGNGKTTMINAIQQATLVLMRNSLMDTEKGLCIEHALDIVRYNSSDYKKFVRISLAPLLAIDDLGTEPAEVLHYGTALSPVTELIEKRYEQDCLTIISTNMARDEIRPRYGDRIADRLNEFCRVIFKHGTYRI